MKSSNKVTHYHFFLPEKNPKDEQNKGSYYYLIEFMKILENARYNLSKSNYGVFKYLKQHHGKLEVFWPNLHENNLVSNDQFIYLIKILLFHPKWSKLARSLFRAEKIIEANEHEKQEIVSRVITNGGEELWDQLINCKGRNLIAEYYQYELNKITSFKEKAEFIRKIFHVHGRCTEQLLQTYIDGKNSVLWFFLNQDMSAAHRLMIVIESSFPVELLIDEFNQAQKMDCSLLDALHNLPPYQGLRTNRFSKFYYAIFPKTPAFALHRNPINFTQYYPFGIFELTNDSLQPLPYTGNFFNTANTATAKANVLNTQNDLQVQVIDRPAAEKKRQTNPDEMDSQSKKTKHEHEPIDVQSFLDQLHSLSADELLSILNNCHDAHETLINNTSANSPTYGDEFLDKSKNLPFASSPTNFFSDNQTTDDQATNTSNDDYLKFINRLT